MKYSINMRYLFIMVVVLLSSLACQIPVLVQPTPTTEKRCPLPRWSEKQLIDIFDIFDVVTSAAKN